MMKFSIEISKLLSGLANLPHDARRNPPAARVVTRISGRPLINGMRLDPCLLWNHSRCGIYQKSSVRKA